RRDIHGDSINKAQLKDFWDQISDQSFDSRLRTVFDIVDKDADGRITKEEIKESICLSATTNKLSNIQQQAEEYAALIMEELDPEETGFIMVSVYPREVQPENPNSYRARKREYFRMRRKRRKAREAGAAANLHERFEQHRHVDLLNGICASKKSKVRFKINDICASKLHLQLHFAIAIAYSPLFAMRIIEKQQ
ncbi:hypothetical protein S245_036765, partial [Arachis hypogaea]